jgi:signal transduction histidine kinase
MIATDFVAELLESGASAAFVREYLDLARRGMRQSLRMTHDFVTLGQVGAGTLRLRPATVDVAMVLAEARALSELLARANRVDVRVVLGRPLPSLVADADRLL